MPAAVAAQINMSATGREPLNNQPFFRHDRVGPDMAVRARTRPHLDYLCASLRAVERLLDSRRRLGRGSRLSKQPCDGIPAG